MKTIFIAGHNGMVGSAIYRKLEKSSAHKIITANRKELDLTCQKSVLNFFEKNKINEVYLAAAKVGGIYSNSTYPAEFIYENLMIELNVIHSAFITGVKKLLFLGSSCIYPKFSKQPINENQLLHGFLEKTNEPYAIAKIAGIKICESYNRQYAKSHRLDYRSLMPTNLYGPGDSYHSENSHVVPALIRRFHEAKALQKEYVEVWGTGKPRREFLHVDDLANACEVVMNLDKELYEKYTEPMQSHINVGYGEDISILELAKMISQIVGYSGKIIFNKSKPDGVQKKLLDSKIINKIGWNPCIKLDDGIASAYEDFLMNINKWN